MLKAFTVKVKPGTRGGMGCQAIWHRGLRAGGNVEDIF
jgi:hypothetical protein